MVDLDAMRSWLDGEGIALYDVTEPGGRINYDGTPGDVRSLLVYAFNADEAAETAREILSMPEEIDLVVAQVSAPRVHENWVGA